MSKTTRKWRPPIDPKLNGQRFGRLVAGDAVRKGSKWRILCKCDCGNEKSIQYDNLKNGSSTSCGCRCKEVTILRSTKHGDCQRGKRAPEFTVWASMIARCTNPKTKYFNRYGGRGITVCQKWRDSYESFLTDVGRRPSAKHSIDRINNNGNYEPGNVRWATSLEQNNNRRDNVIWEFSGKRQTIGQWGQELNIKPKLLWQRRFVAKWSLEKTLTTPVRKWI